MDKEAFKHEIFSGIQRYIIEALNFLFYFGQLPWDLPIKEENLDWGRELPDLSYWQDPETYEKAKDNYSYRATYKGTLKVGGVSYEAKIFVRIFIQPNETEFKSYINDIHIRLEDARQAFYYAISTEHTFQGRRFQSRAVVQPKVEPSPHWWLEKLPEWWYNPPPRT